MTTESEAGMTDSNHAPLTERERVARFIETAIVERVNAGAFVVDIALAAADAILADPAYARQRAAMTFAMEACRINDEAVEEGHEQVGELVLHLLSAADPARAARALTGDGR